MNFLARRRLGFKVLILTAVAAAWVFARSDGAPEGFTAGFGEPDCTQCHSDNPLDSGRDMGGMFDIVGVPDQYTPGETYTITVNISHPGQSRWGFELAARFMADTSQAGTIVPDDLDTTQIVGSGIQYLTHTNNGTYPGFSDMPPAPWSFQWTAPQDGTVVFHATGNAADNDSTPFGDYIYSAAKTTSPATTAVNE